MTQPTTQALYCLNLVGGLPGALFVRRWSSHPDARWGIWRQETPTMAGLLYETADDMTHDARNPGHR